MITYGQFLEHFILLINLWCPRHVKVTPKFGNRLNKYFIFEKLSLDGNR